MKFELPPDNRNLSDEDLLEDLKKVAEKLNTKTLGSRDYDVHGIVYSTTVMRRFGGWNNALNKAGLEIQQRINIPDDELFEEIYRIWMLKGSHPSKRDLTKYNSVFSEGPYYRRFKSWRKVLEAFVNYVNTQEDQENIQINSIEVKKRSAREANLRMRFLTLKKADFKCESCGRSPANNPGLELHVDHHIPYSKGGETILENLRCLCSDCNLGKSNLM